MNEEKHIVIFSHGFGVHKDDRGLFTDITAALRDVKTVMFDYNEIDEQNNTITVLPFSDQVEKLKKIVEEQRQAMPNAVIDLICHSQGSLVVAIAKLSDIRKTVLIAPPTDVGIERTLRRYKDNPKAEIDLDGLTKLPRTDGSITLVPAKYWRERNDVDAPVSLYNKLAEATELIIIKAKQDNVLGETLFDNLDKSVQMIELDGDHGFTKSRVRLLEVISDIVL